MTGITSFRYRKAGAATGKKLGDLQHKTDIGIWPLAIEHSTNSVYVLADLDGRDALYRMSLDGIGAPRRWSQSMTRSTSTGLPGSIGDCRSSAINTPTIGAGRSISIRNSRNWRARSAERSRDPANRFAAASRDGKTLLVHASADTDPGAYYLLDRASKKMEPLLLSREHLGGQKSRRFNPSAIRLRTGR